MRRENCELELFLDLPMHLVLVSVKKLKESLLFRLDFSEETDDSERVDLREALCVRL